MRLSSPPLFAALSTGLLACTSDPGVTVHNADPRAEITSHADGDSPDAGLRGFTGIVEDPDHDAEQLELSWLLDGVEACPPVSPDASGNTSCEIFLESGERTVTLQVMDPLGGLASDKVTLEVQPYGDPWAEISAPEAGGIYYSDQLIDFIGVVGDEADAAGDLEAWWESGGEALDVLAEPDSSGNVIGSGYLEQGDHQLVLKVRNSGGNEAFDSVTIQVGTPNSAPSCDITFPEDGASGPFGDPLALTAEVSDPDVPADWLTVSWTSDHDGALGDSSPSSSGEVAFATTLSSIATHTITMRVEDELGASCSDFVQYTVEDCSETFYADSDGDGYGDPAVTTTGCEAPSGYVADSGPGLEDCDDGDAAIHPAATEVCNGIDDDCDGDTDDDDSSLDSSTGSTWYIDSDGDGYGDASGSTQACNQPSGYAADTSDCDDSSASTHPRADEYCDGVDTDCDGTTDESDAIDASSWYADSDGDGYGDPLSTSRACTAPSGHVASSSDCDDSSAAIHPGADEYCDGVDTDCDGALDEDDAIDASEWYADADGDGYGDPGSSSAACTAPSGHVGDSSDCDDGDSGIHPGATEIVGDEVDADCDGVEICYVDGDSDGYRTASSITSLDSDCADEGEATIAASIGDCDDLEAAVNPGADEYCDAVDNDCDGDVDEDDAIDVVEWFIDTDGDGFGDSHSAISSCASPTGYVADGTDCDDGSSASYPGADEYCDGVDTDCDGEFDEDDALDATSWYLDFDGDGFGDPSTVQVGCVAPSSYVSIGEDCDDLDAASNPGATEVCGNGVDDDCDADPDDCAFATSSSLADADAFFYGGIAGAMAGFSVCGAGDVDGDGFDDIVVGAYLSNPGGSQSGEVYLISGSTSPTTHELGSGDIRLTGDAPGDHVGVSVAGAGDVDGDGYDDLLIGADYYDSSFSAAGGAFLILGGPSISHTSMSSADAVMYGENGLDYVGYSVAGAGDFNGDGLADMLLGAPGYDEAFDTQPGAAFLVLGSSSPADLGVSSADAFYFGEGTGYGNAGYAVSGAGDVDGDGLNELLIGAPWLSNSTDDFVGAAYVVFGAATPTSGSLVDADLRFEGEAYLDRAGETVGGGGDVDGDGYSDLLVGAYGHSSEVAAYLIFGGLEASSGSLADADVAFSYTGIGPAAVSIVDDLNADGMDDLLVGLQHASSNGAVYLFMGDPYLANMPVHDADSEFLGDTASSFAGASVAGAGDVNADGVGDFVLGGPYNSVGASEAGAAWLVLGMSL